MRTRILITFLFFTTSVLGQTADSLGLDNYTTPTSQEADFFNSMLKDKRGEFSFVNKKIAFVTGNSGATILSKSDYFKRCVKPWIVKGNRPQILMIRLTEEEKQKSGGYDVLVLSWVKLFTDNQKRRIINRLRKKTKLQPAANITLAYMVCDYQAIGYIPLIITCPV
ncbi:MAG: hypothetical protein J7502_19140 [Flavisolibacter sp.]|nr:hypothetical protein [Flavisolibacter sp.]